MRCHGGQILYLSLEYFSAFTNMSQGEGMYAARSSFEAELTGTQFQVCSLSYALFWYFCINVFSMN